MTKWLGPVASRSGGQIGTIVLLTAVGAPASAEDEMIGLETAFSGSFETSVIDEANDGTETEATLTLEWVWRYGFANGWGVSVTLEPELEASADRENSFAAKDPTVSSEIVVTTPGGLSFGVEYEADFVRDEGSFDNEESTIFIESERFGRIAYGDTDDALEELCVEAPGGTNTFEASDLAEFGTCESFGVEGTLIYISPVFSNGVTAALSYSDATSDFIDKGDATTSFSAALAFEGPVGENTVEWSLGIANATDFEGEAEFGGDRATALQAGLTLVRGAFGYLASASLQTFDTVPDDQYGIALGVEWRPVDGLLLAAGVTQARRIDFGGFMETGDARGYIDRTYGLAAEYAIYDDTIIFDVGVSRLETDFPGEDDDTLFGVGFAYEF